MWSYSNTHGDITVTTDNSGAKQGPTRAYDPFGKTLATVAEIDNSHGEFDYGWLGEHQRPLEHQSGIIPVIEMGARQYDPFLGRFLEVDPVEGGSCNDYDYVCGDGVNEDDLDGKACFSCWAKNAARAMKSGRSAVRQARNLYRSGKRVVARSYAPRAALWAKRTFTRRTFANAWNRVRSTNAWRAVRTGFYFASTLAAAAGGAASCTGGAATGPGGVLICGMALAGIAGAAYTYRESLMSIDRRCGWFQRRDRGRKCR